MRNALAFWRREPTERRISRETFFTENFFFEYCLNSATSALVQGFLRRRLVFLAIHSSNDCNEVVRLPRTWASMLRRYITAALTAFTGRALTTFRAGFALKIIGSFVNGLMPLRSFVAGFLMTTNLANPGRTKAPDLLSSL
jgi:hypothetical protein